MWIAILNFILWFVLGIVSIVDKPNKTTKQWKTDYILTWVVLLLNLFSMIGVFIK